jgi:hypothetical protein
MAMVTAYQNEYDMLKRSIKEEGRLLLPVVLNQDKIVLEGHNRIRDCRELHVPISWFKKDFTGKHLDEIMYVVYVNLYGRHLKISSSVQKIKCSAIEDNEYW